MFNNIPTLALKELTKLHKSIKNPVFFEDKEIVQSSLNQIKKILSILSNYPNKLIQANKNAKDDAKNAKNNEDLKSDL